MVTALEAAERYPVPHRIAKLMTSAVSSSLSCNRYAVLLSREKVFWCLSVRVFRFFKNMT